MVIFKTLLGGCVTRLLLAAVVLGLLVGFVYAIDMAVYPWAYPLFTRPALTGGWFGNLRATHGSRTELFGVYVWIEHRAPQRYRYDDFGGQVNICTRSGVLTRGSSRGTYRWWLRGKTDPFQLMFESLRRPRARGESLPPLKAPYLGIIGAQLTGTWSGNTARLSGKGSLGFVVRDEPASETSFPANEPLTQTGTTITAILQKGSVDDYLAGCRALSSARK